MRNTKAHWRPQRILMVHTSTIGNQTYNLRGRNNVRAVKSSTVLIYIFEVPNLRVVRLLESLTTINEHVGDVDLEIATSLLTLWSLSLFSQKASKRSQRSSRWSKTAFMHSWVLAISWRTNAISDWDGDGSFAAKSWRCNIWLESLVKFPTDRISPDGQIWFPTNKSSSDEQIEFPTNGIPSCKVEFPTKGNKTDAVAGNNPT